MRVHGFSCILSDSNANDRVNCELSLRVKMIYYSEKKKEEKRKINRRNISSISEERELLLFLRVRVYYLKKEKKN